MKVHFENKKELICYAVLLLFLIMIVLCNNIFWKLGKNIKSTGNDIDYLESNNVIYDVPYEEKVLD